MNPLAELRRRFQAALSGLSTNTDELLAMIRPSQEAKFGDYQANCAMPLAKELKRSPREVAASIVERLDVTDLCEPPTVAGPGFVNLRLTDAWIAEQFAGLLSDPRLGVEPAGRPRKYVIDYSAPNVAKPMHVGHIRSTVIGDSLYRVLRFLGHDVIGDNHVGDWGTQFGMIIYGYRHFVDRSAYERDPVSELARMYRVVHKLVSYHEGRNGLADRLKQIAQQEAELVASSAKAAEGDAKAAAKTAKNWRRLETKLAEARTELADFTAKLAEVDDDPVLSELAGKHPGIAAAVLQETAKLHAGDEENLRLWREFLPPCQAEMESIYARLNVRFDYTLGESFYHPRLAAVVEDLAAKQIARVSDGAMCVFLEGYDTPLLIRKQDGAFLYATTDLATIQYRMQEFQPDAVLYVVDHRQSRHFEQLFATARLWGFTDVELNHIRFGTVLGEDGRPFKTRSGDTVGLSGLLDEAVGRAHAIVSANDDSKPSGAELSAEERSRVAEVVGVAALKYADLSQNRESDYVFSYDKMLAMNGNTATYMQYAYARVRNIFARGGVDVQQLRTTGAAIRLGHPSERALALAVLQFSEALEMTVADYRPNQLTNYLFELANRYSTFYDHCPVLKAEDEPTRDSRLLLCDLTARTLAKGLELLGIDVVEKM